MVVGSLCDLCCPSQSPGSFIYSADMMSSLSVTTSWDVLCYGSLYHSGISMDSGAHCVLGEES